MTKSASIDVPKELDRIRRERLAREAKAKGDANSAGADRRPPEFSDESLALRYTAQHKDVLRYLATMGKWLVWDGTRWALDETLIARYWARETCRKASTECNSKHARLIASAKTVSAVERLAQAAREHAATVDQWDRDPWLLNTPAGTVDLRTGKMHKHDPGNHLTKITAVAPDRSCSITTWLTFLQRVTGGNAELVGYLQRIGGYCLTESTQEHAMFFAHGGGANGKTTFINTIAGIMGDYAATTPIETLTETGRDRHPTELARLCGKRLVTATETEQGRRWAESRIKELTGGDRIAARFMKKDYFEYNPEFKLFVSGNHKPELRSVDEAIRRRFNVLPFDVTIPKEERDEKLSEKLCAEWPGILAWLIDGCSAWRAAGLAPPEVARDATRDYLNDEDTIALWVEDCCVEDPRSIPGSTELYKSWKQWKENRGEPPGAQKPFSQALEKRFTRHRDRKGAFFKGLWPKNHPDQKQEV